MRNTFPVYIFPEKHPFSLVANPMHVGTRRKDKYGGLPPKNQLVC
jgi:hypothetical protein